MNQVRRNAIPAMQNMGRAVGSTAKLSFRLLLLLLFSLLIFFAVVSAVLRLGSPYISSYKGEMQSWVSDYLRTPVEIGSIDFEWRAASPRITLDNVALQSTEDNVRPVKLAKILLDLDLLKTIFIDGWHINEVTIAGADLSLEYLGAQNFKVRGYEFPGRDKSEPNDKKPKLTSAIRPTSELSGSDDGLDVMSWLLNAGRVGLIDSRIKLLDATRGIDYQIDALNIRAENTSELHQLRIDLQLPDQLGSRIEIDVDLDRMSDVTGYRNSAELSGGFYISGEQLHLENWAALWPERKIGLIGRSDLRLWGSWKGDRIYDTRGQIEGQDITLSRIGDLLSTDSSAGEQNPLKQKLPLGELFADVHWQRKDDGWVTDIDRLASTHAGVTNQLRSSRLAVLDTSTSRQWQIEAGGDLFDLSVLGALTATLQDVLPLGEIPAAINRVNPEGKFSNWSLIVKKGWNGENAGSVPGFSVSGRLDDLATQHYAGIPAMSGVDAEIRIVDNVGTLDVSGSDFQLLHPSVFPSALKLDEISGRFSVKVTDREFSLGAEGVTLLDDGFSASNSFSLQKLRSQTARIEMRGDFELDDVTRFGDYLPRGKIRKPVALWIDRAFKQGRASSGKLLWVGDPARFPYSNGDGVFKVSMDVTEGVLDYRDDWPPLTGVDAELLISGPSIKVKTRTANFDGIALGNSTAQIKNLFKPVLEIEAEATAALQEFVRSANNGPLRSVLSPAFGQSRGTGNASMTLSARVPLRARRFREKDEVFSVAGHLALSGNTLDSKRFGLALENLNGRVNFTHDGFSIDQLQASYLGQLIDLGAHTSGRGKNRISDLSLSGVVSADEVLREYGIPIDIFFTGKSPWYINLEIPHSAGQATRFTASSELLGSEISLPTPLSKTHREKLRVIVSTEFGRGVGQDVWNIRWGKIARARVRASEDKGLQSMVLDFGRATSNLQLPVAGLKVSGHAGTFALDGWVAAISNIIDNLPPAEGDAELLMQVSAKLSVDDLIVGRRLQGAASFRVNTDDIYLNGVINSAELKGNIRIPRVYWDKNEPVLARISYASKKLIDDLSEGPEGVEDEVGAPLDPREFPRLNIHLANFSWDELQLKEIKLLSEPSRAGMKITTLGFAHNHAQLTGEGFWHWRDPQQVNPSFDGQQITQLDLQLLSNDIGKAISSLGFSDAMAEGRGTVEFDLGWQGPLYKPNAADLKGNVQIALKKGRILKVDPGAARMFGLFALQSIPRRLTLDFRDMTRDGLDYNRINGSIKLANGLATTSLVQLEGPVGVIDVTGTSNYVTQTYNQKITVLPRLSGALPIIGLISGGATAGIGALVAGPILKALGIDIDKLALSRYKVTGSWDNPVIKPDS